MAESKAEGWRRIPGFEEYEINIHGVIRVLPARHKMVRKGNFVVLWAGGERVKCCIGEMLVRAWAPELDRTGLQIEALTLERDKYKRRVVELKEELERHVTGVASRNFSDGDYHREPDFGLGF
ncbi:MAG: hypothetical protein ACK5JO_03870 [Halodesulfovibrio sp.]